MAAPFFIADLIMLLSLQGRHERYKLGEQPAEEEDERYVYKHLEH
jgi:hypothetical protein